MADGKQSVLVPKGYYRIQGPWVSSIIRESYQLALVNLGKASLTFGAGRPLFRNLLPLRGLAFPRLTTTSC